MNRGSEKTSLYEDVSPSSTNSSLEDLSSEFNKSKINYALPLMNLSGILRNDLPIGPSINLESPIIQGNVDEGTEEEGAADNEDIILLECLKKFFKMHNSNLQKCTELICDYVKNKDKPLIIDLDNDPNLFESAAMISHFNKVVLDILEVFCDKSNVHINNYIKMFLIEHINCINKIFEHIQISRRMIRDTQEELVKNNTFLKVIYKYITNYAENNKYIEDVVYEIIHFGTRLNEIIKNQNKKKPKQKPKPRKAQLEKEQNVIEQLQQEIHLLRYELRGHEQYLQQYRHTNPATNYQIPSQGLQTYPMNAYTSTSNNLYNNPTMFHPNVYNN